MNFTSFLCLLINSFLPKKKVVGRGDYFSYFCAEYGWANIDFKLFSSHINLENKIVLDIGCGLGGKTLFYAEKGCQKIIGIDINKSNIMYAKKFTNRITNISFVIGDVSFLPFKSNQFDIILMNDLLEHIKKDALFFVLNESKRVIRNSCSICITFPPWTSPYAAHLYDYIYIPWVHIIFSTNTIVSSIKNMKNIPEKDTIIQEFCELNRLTIKEFNALIKKLDFNIVYFYFRMIKNLKFIKYIPLINKYFVHRVVAILSK